MVDITHDIGTSPLIEVFPSQKDFYHIIAPLVTDTKIVRINTLLEWAIGGFLTKQNLKSRKSKYTPSLWEFKHKGKAIWEMSNDEIIARDASKVAREIWPFKKWWLGESSDFVVVRSVKQAERILGFWYQQEKNHQSNTRIYVRYSTLCGNPGLTLQVVQSIRSKFSHIEHI